jgi:hypothetical protein
MKDVEFAVDDKSGRQRTFKSFDKAAGFAVSLAASDGEPHDVDVLVWSLAGARAFAGDDGVGQYEEDPDASVFERITVRAEAKGRIP